MGVALAVMGVYGYLTEKRKRDPDGLRRFLIWYALLWPFMAFAFCAMFYPRLHWLYAVDAAMAAGSYVWQIVIWRQAKAAARAEAERSPLDS